MNRAFVVALVLVSAACVGGFVLLGQAPTITRTASGSVPMLQARGGAKPSPRVGYSAIRTLGTGAVGHAGPVAPNEPLTESALTPYQREVVRQPLATLDELERHAATKPDALLLSRVKAEREKLLAAAHSIGVEGERDLPRRSEP